MTGSGVVRIGVLGAARITPAALIEPAAEIDGVHVVGVAARDVDRGRRFAARHGIPEVYSGYEGLLADPTINAIYIPLPPALHGEWMRRAIAAGKHVLCEKPFAANAAEAASVALDAERSGLTVMEAFHYRYHPLMRRLVEIASSGEIGTLTGVEATFRAVLPPGGDIRWDFALGGGSTMDLGAYAVHLIRSVAGEEPAVVWASARRSGDIDRALEAEVRFPSGMTGRFASSMWTARLPDARAVVTGTEGSVSVLNPYVSQLPSRFTVRTAAGVRRERFGDRSTYSWQLEAFRDAIQRGIPPLTGPADAVANMTVVDAAYRAAGMRLRQPMP